MRPHQPIEKGDNRSKHTDCLFQEKLLTERALAYPAGQLLQVCGEPLQYLLVIKTGLAKARSLQKNEAEEVLYLLGPRDLIGIESLLGTQDVWLDLIALTDVEVVRLPIPSFKKMLRLDPSLYLICIQQLKERLDTLTRRTMQRRLSTHQRLLEVMVDLAIKASGQDGEQLQTAPLVPFLPLSEMSGLVGVSRETVSRSLNHLKRRGVIRKMEAGWAVTSIPNGETPFNNPQTIWPETNGHDLLRWPAGRESFRPH